jgi:uncharacterized membrane protein
VIVFLHGSIYQLRMTTRDIVAVGLRLFALQHLVIGIVSLFGVIEQFAGRSPHNAYFMPISFIVVAALEWFLSSAIGKIVAKNHDSECSLGGLTLENVYSVAFVVLGLYFILSSIGPMISGLHNYQYFLSDKKMLEMNNKNLTGNFVTLLAGFIALLPANLWARKLARQARPSALG